MSSAGGDAVLRTIDPALSLELPAPSENVFAALIERTGEAVILVDGKTGALIEANSAFCELLGYPREAALTLNLFDFVADKPENIRANLCTVVEEGYARFPHRRYRHAQGMLLDVEITATAVYAPSGPVLGVIARNITDRKIAEREQARLREAVTNAAAEWRQTFDAISSPIFVVDKGRRILRLNTAAAEYLQCGFSALIQSSFPMAEEEPWNVIGAAVDAALSTGQLQQCHTTDKAKRTLQVSATPGASGLAVVVLHDVTAMTQLQDSLQRSEKMSAMGALVAGVAHEVRNPLFNISMLVDALEMVSPFTKEQQPHVAQLRNELGRLNRLMNDLLAYGKSIRIEKVSTNIQDLVHVAIDLNSQLSKSREIKVTFTSNGAVTATVDTSRVTDALRNLIENAIHHSPTQGTVEVKLEKKAESFEISVHDSGPGFSAEALAHAFEPFYSRRAGGTGLGLPLVQRVVLEHGGEIELGNHESGGGLVRFCIPLTLAPASLSKIEPA